MHGGLTVFEFSVMDPPHRNLRWGQRQSENARMNTQAKRRINAHLRKAKIHDWAGQ